MGLRNHSEYYWKGSQTRKENRSVQCGQSVTVLFTHNVNKIKDAAHKNGDVDDKCKETLMGKIHWNLIFTEPAVSSHLPVTTESCSNMLH